MNNQSVLKIFKYNFHDKPGTVHIYCKYSGQIIVVNSVHIYM
jgi:hypothetical protein